MRNALILLLFSSLFFLSCTACPECGKDESVTTDIDIDNEQLVDIDVDDAINCPPYTGECAFSETQICKDDDLYICVQILKDGCIDRYHYQRVAVCSSGCKVDVEQSATAPGEAHCIPLSEDPCPDFSLINFPLKDESGAYTFCRDCDTPTAESPVCLENLWKDSNERLCVDMPTYDCCGYPCAMNDLTPKYRENLSSGRYQSEAITRCDIVVNPKNPDGWSLHSYSYGEPQYGYRLSYGKIGFYARHSNVWTVEYYSNNRYFEYDLKTQKYQVVAGSSLSGFGYHNGTFVGGVLNLKKNLPEDFGYPVLIDGSGTRKVLKWNVYRFRSTAVLTDKWIVMNVRSGYTNFTLYGRIDESSLSNFGEAIYNPSIVDDTLIFSSDDYEYSEKGYVCRLDETRDLDRCDLFNRSGERFDTAQLDRENPYRIYYADSLVPGRIIHVDIMEKPFLYTEFDVAFGATLEHTKIKAVSGNIMLIEQGFKGLGGITDHRLCYYRLDWEELFCSSPVLWDGSNVFDMRNGDFEGHTLVWNDYSMLKARDMECYCDWNPELCPFDDYTPNLEHPKIKGFRDERL